MRKNATSDTKLMIISAYVSIQTQQQPPNYCCHRHSHSADVTGTRRLGVPSRSAVEPVAWPMSVEGDYSSKGLHLIAAQPRRLSNRRVWPLWP